MKDDKGSSTLGILVVVAIVVIAAAIAGGYHFGKSSKTKDKSGVENDIAEKKEDERYLTIVNKLLWEKELKLMRHTRKIPKKIVFQ